MRIKVEMDAGTSINDAFVQAIRLAKKLEIKVDFNFNGVLCVAYPNGDAVKGADEYFAACNGTSKIKNLAFS